MYLYVRAFADKKSQIKSDLRGATKVVMNHLIKVWLYPEVREQNHWKQEIAQTLNDLPKLKGTNKYPKFEFLIENTFNVYEDTLERRAEVIIESIEESPILFEFNNLYSAIEEYFVWICTELSKSGIVRYNDIYLKIEELRSKYLNLK